MLHLAAQAPCRWRPLSSNVRQHHGALKLLAIASGATVAAKDQMHSPPASVPARKCLSGSAQVPRPVHLQSKVWSQRFAATDLCLSIRRLQSVLGAAATRQSVPAFSAGSGGGMSGCCATLQRSRICDQSGNPKPLGRGLPPRLGSPQAVLPNPSLERTSTGWPRYTVLLFSAPRGQPVASAQLKR